MQPSTLKNDLQPLIPLFLALLRSGRLDELHEEITKCSKILTEI